MENEISKINKDIDLSEIKKHQDNLKIILSEKPDQRIVKQNKYAGNSNYIPIGIIQSLLDKFFLDWDWAINDVQLILNSVMVRGTLTLKTAAGSIRKIDGIASSEIQLKKGENILSADTLNSKALERDVPKAESEAFKNAAKKIGRKFGRDLNRKESYGHSPDEELLNKIFTNK
jgi:hypothetical protein